MQPPELLKLGQEQFVFREEEILQRGLTLEQVHRFVEEGTLYHSAQGVYSLVEADITEQHTRVEVACRFPQSVICLLTALEFHDLTTQLPHQVWIAYEESSPIPNEPKLPINITSMPKQIFNLGIDTHYLEGVKVRIYNIPKTVVDCFVFESKVGIDVAIEALHQGIEEKRFTKEEIMHYAQACQVTDEILLYL